MVSNLSHFTNYHNLLYILYIYLFNKSLLAKYIYIYIYRVYEIKVKSLSIDYNIIFSSFFSMAYKIIRINFVKTCDVCGARSGIYICIHISLILEFRGKFLSIARDIAREISRIARGTARRLRGIHRQLRGLCGKFRENSPKFCVILKKFRTNFKVLHGQDPNN